MSDPKTFQKLRPAGRLEKFSTARHALGIYNNVSSSAVYSTSKPGPKSIETLMFRTLAAVIAQHPSLTAIPVDEDKESTYFVRLPKVDLKDAVIFLDREHDFDETGGACDEELDNVVERYHNHDQKDRYGEIPFWKLIILREPKNNSRFAAAFIFHHAVGDGMSGLAFHRTFLTALQGVEASDSQDENFCTVITPPDMPMIPTLETLHPLPLSLFFLFKAIIAEFVYGPPKDHWNAEPISLDPDKRRRRFRSISLSSDLTQKLVAASRAHSTSVTGALVACFADSLFANLEPEKSAALLVDGAVSLRRFLPSNVINEDSMGCWVSRFEHKHLRTSTTVDAKSGGSPFPWEEAKAVKDSIDAELAKNGRDAVTGLLRWAGNMNQFFLKKNGKTRGNSFELSNVGVFKAHPSTKVNGTDHEDSGWRIGRMLFSQSADLTGPPVHVTVVTGGDGCLSIGFSWLAMNFEDAWFEKVLKDFRARLDGI
ncbi:hypothetical protein NA57DRAFT_42937 [Rhizodiscina lignyota]|uniref:Alcohol acetyltransferase n=1 Tax=Rhizodiscina lignyota TaxID=1504668 RepID=A0A9P4I8G4_9PEZI|nr:hypothetical protein NA57DRAFT_42937 [Rhizodiscina lignyota]